MTEKVVSVDCEIMDSKLYKKVVKHFGFAEASKILEETEQELKQGMGGSQSRLDEAKAQVESNSQYSASKAIIDDFNDSLRKCTAGDRAVLNLRRRLLQQKKGNDLKVT